MDIAILYALLAMIGFGLHSAVSKVPVQKIGVVRTIFYRNSFLVLFFIPLLFFSEGTFSLFYIGLTILISIIGYAGFLSFYRAIDSGAVGIVVPVANSSVVFTVLFSILFFGETLTTQQVIAIGLIVIGVILISMRWGDFSRRGIRLAAGIPFAILTCLLWGLLFALFRIPVLVIGPILTAFIIEFMFLVYSFSYLRFKGLRFCIPKKIYPHIIAVGIFGGVGALGYNLGLSVSDVSIVAAITFSNPVISSLYGHIVYGERLTIQQWATVLIIIIGIVLISIY